MIRFSNGLFDRTLLQLAVASRFWEIHLSGPRNSRSGRGKWRTLQLSLCLRGMSQICDLVLVVLGFGGHVCGLGELWIRFFVVLI